MVAGEVVVNKYLLFYSFLSALLHFRETDRASFPGGYLLTLG